MTETATGSWVAPSSPGTRSYSGSGQFTIDIDSFAVTDISRDLRKSYVGESSSFVIVPWTSLKKGGVVTLNWWDQNANFRSVSASITDEKLLTIAGAISKVAIVSYVGTTIGMWRVGEQYSTGQETDTFSYDESAGIRMEYHGVGQYAFQSSSHSWQETFTGDIKVTSVQFDIGDYVAVNTHPATYISVDGNNVSANSLPKLFVWPWGSTHSITASPVVTVSTGTRLVFQGWSDGSKEATRTLSADTSGELDCTYKRQYLLTIGSPYGGTAGSGWYDEESTVMVHVDSSAFFLLVFDGWSDYSLPPEPDVQVTMSGPVTLHANWRLDAVRLAIVVVVIAGVVCGILLYRRRKSDRTRGFYDRAITVPISRSVFCISCGAELREGARFCRKCGAAQL